MTVSPLRNARLQSPTPARWDLDLPLPVAPRPAPLPAPRPAPAPTARTNVARLQGENIRYAGEGNAWGVDMKYLQADLLDLTPEDPLSVWEFGSYKINVKSGLIQLHEAQAQAMAKSLVAGQGPGFPLRSASVEYKSGNQVKLKGRASLKGLPIPFSVTTRLSVTGPSTLKADPTSVRLFGVPVLWAAKLFNVDLASKLPLPADGPARMDADYGVTVDLKKTGLFEGELKSLTVANGRLDMKIGAEPAASLRGARTDGVANYAYLKAEGELALESAILRDADVMIIDETPETPYAFNYWDTEGYAKIERGQVILDEARLIQKFMGGADSGEGFQMKKAKLEGQDMVVEGTYNFLYDLPIKFKIRFSVENGQLKLTPHSMRVLGIGMGFAEGMILDTLKEIEGAKKSGDGVLLDLRVASKVDMGRIKGLKTEPGRIVLQR